MYSPTVQQQSASNNSANVSSSSSSSAGTGVSSSNPHQTDYADINQSTHHQMGLNHYTTSGDVVSTSPSSAYLLSHHHHNLNNNHHQHMPLHQIHHSLQHSNGSASIYHNPMHSHLSGVGGGGYSLPISSPQQQHPGAHLGHYGAHDHTNSPDIYQSSRN